VRLWRKGTRRVSSDRALEIEREFNIPRHQLRPDLWSES
jgi:DNA-binding transcriptional regulator YdaS (Cro superfamily)